MVGIKKMRRFSILVVVAFCGLMILVVVNMFAGTKRPKAVRPPENAELRRNFCNITYNDGQICPKLYTELGGVCDLKKEGIWNCTDIRNHSTYDLRQAQLAITRLLRIFDVLARKHGIRYWITSATLLGAARHKGFVPWDSDGDIEMPLDDYERFFRYASKELPKDVFFQNTETDTYLKPDPEKYPGLYESKKYKNIGMYQRTWNPRLRDENSCYKYCIQRNCKWHDGLMVDMYVVEKVPRNYLPLQELMFEGFPFLVPRGWKGVLKDKYGPDYMEVPLEGSKNRFQWDSPDALHSCEQLITKGS